MVTAGSTQSGPGGIRSRWASSCSAVRRHASAFAGIALVTAGAVALVACHGRESQERASLAAGDGGTSEAAVASASVASSAALEAKLQKRRLQNVVAYIPPQCFTKTQAEGSGTAKNPCYVCHVDSAAPNFASDGNLQVTLSLPAAAADNPWKNLFAPPVAGAPRASDEDVLAYVRAGNYFDRGLGLALAKALEALPGEWDIDGDGKWDGYVPDVWFAFDERGFDHAPGGAPTGWRAFAYYPFPGTFFPTNGSTDDVLIRLDARLQKDRAGRIDQGIYELNLAVVEALITRQDVPIDPVDEAALGLDVDLDGRLARADRVAFDAAPDRMHYAGLAGDEQRGGRFPMAPGLFPLGTEFFHTVRYLDVDAGGAVTMAPRMKEVRYAKKTTFLGYDALRGRAALDAREQLVSRDGSRRVNWQGERGVDNGQGWVFQGFIESKDGTLRPQSREETTFCAGCHGGIGATTDSVFSFARKLGATQWARGWFHWSQRGLRGLAEPKRSDGRYEYTTYLEEAGAGDELRENREVLGRFFDARGELRTSEVRQLHDDVSRLLLPSAGRALDLDRAYRAVVEQQSFDRGRDAVLAPSRNVLATVIPGQPTGITSPVAAAALARR